MEKDAFKKAYHFLTTACNDSRFAVIGYELGNTLSEYGSVSRGVIAEKQSSSNDGH